MKKATFNKINDNQSNNNRNSKVFNYALSTNLKNVENKCLIFQTNSQASSSYLQRSLSADNVIKTRGFKPSDRHDPAKRNFLEHLTSKILHFDMETAPAKTIDLKKLLTPAMDSNTLLQPKNKKMYASSCFYAPTHPTVEDQVELARRISYSLSDVKNLKSKGQSMYVNRKKRSVKWIHDGNGLDGEDECESPMPRDKMPLKCVMNPNGKVLDIQGIQALGEEPNIGTSPLNAEKLFDIVHDLNNQKGRGAEIFAKRRKRSEKWVVDKEQPSTPMKNDQEKLEYPSPKTNYQPMNSLNFKNQPQFSSVRPADQNNTNNNFFNPFTMDISLSNLSMPPKEKSSEKKSNGNMSRKPAPEVVKIYLKEVAVGTEPEYFENDQYPNDSYKSLGKRHRDSFDLDRYLETHSNPSNYHGYPKQQMVPMESMKNGHNHNRYNQNQFEHRRDLEVNGDQKNYTPVPVKQLIQEFEKTCRPVFQYKQIIPKKPTIQNPPMENISKFFDSPRAQSKYNLPQDIAKYPVNGSEMKKLNPHLNGEQFANGYLKKYPPTDFMRINAMGLGYDDNSSDDDEDDDDDDDDSSDSYDDSSSSENCARISRMSLMSNGMSNGMSSGMSNGMSNGTTNGMSNGKSNGTLSNYDYNYHQQSYNSGNEQHQQLQPQQQQQQLLEAPPQFRSDETPDNAFLSKMDLAAQAKSLLLAGITSQEDLESQIGKLRSTAVLDNLMPIPAAEDSTQKESVYNGPKIASYQNLMNYNTAPRGWDQSQSFYRPVTFNKAQVPIPYSDF